MILIARVGTKPPSIFHLSYFMFTFYHNSGHYGLLYGCRLDSMARVQSVDDKAVFVFVGDENAHPEWLQLVFCTDCS